jgi:hypothetical protein
MNTSDITTTLTTLFAELVEGAPQECYILNRGDLGLLRSLDKLSAADASQAATGATIAAHVDHLRYGLSLMNRWAAGENPWSDADWSASWRITSVSEPEWEELRAKLRTEAHRWLSALRSPRDVTTIELNGIVGTIAHLAYHLGAIRQIHRATRGPTESNAPSAWHEPSP